MIMICYELTQLLICLMSIFAAVVCQIAFYRLIASRFLPSFLFGGVVGVIVIMVLTIAGPEPLFGTGWPYWIVNALSFSALFYSYCFIAVCAKTSLRIRILDEISQAKDSLILEDIVKRYHSAEIVSRRIKRLLENGQIYEKEGRLFIKTLTMLLISRIFVLQKRLILGRTFQILDKTTDKKRYLASTNA